MSVFLNHYPNPELCFVLILGLKATRAGGEPAYLGADVLARACLRPCEYASVCGKRPLMLLSDSRPAGWRSTQEPCASQPEVAGLLLPLPHFARPAAAGAWLGRRLQTSATRRWLEHPALQPPVLRRESLLNPSDIIPGRAFSGTRYPLHAAFGSPMRPPET